MEPAKETEVWFITGGTDSGIMKLVGTARSQHAAEAPLIGVAAWHCITGHNDMEKEFCDPKRDRSKMWQYEEKNHSSGGSTYQKQILINPQHSHFFLIKGDDETFGDEHEPRAQFEAAMRSRAMVQDKQLKWKNAILNFDDYMVHGREKEAGRTLEKGWSMRSFKKTGNNTVNSRGDDLQIGGCGDATATPEVALAPTVMVCVQGGKGTVNTVLGALGKGIPVLVVKGSGNAADLIAGKGTSSCTSLVDS